MKASTASQWSLLSLVESQDGMIMHHDHNLKRRQVISIAFKGLCLGATGFAALVLLTLLASVAYQGISWLDWQFLTSFPSRFPAKAGIKSAVVGSACLLGLTTVIAVPIGVSAALYIQELMRPGRVKRLIEINIANLAGVPSIVYGILGLAVFVRFFAFERSLIAGACTLALLVLPIIIISAREALLAVPSSIRNAAYGVGATKWQTIRDHILPVATPGILTGVILSVARAIGETAPLLMIGALTYIAFLPESLFDGFTALPIQIFNWASRPQDAFHELAAAGILVLLAVLLVTNATAIIWRNRVQGKNLCKNL